MNKAPHGPGDTAGYIGRYSLQELLGKGAMGEVYRAILHGPAGFQKTVAIKVLLPSITTRNTDFRSTLTNEARLGGLLKHPNVVETYELGEESELLFIAMEYVSGPTLMKVMRRWHPIPAQAVVNIVSHICQGLSHIHGLQVNGKGVNLVHRDLKPSNILIDRHGLVKIADLGIARAVALDNVDEGILRGTPSYMSPEQMTPDQLDCRSDIFSLGSLIFEMIAGRRLFTGSSTYQLLAQIQSVEDRIASDDFKNPIMASIPDFLPILFKCLRHDPDLRYPSAGALLRDLRALPHFGGADLYTIIQAETLATTSQNISYLNTLQFSTPNSTLPELQLERPINQFCGRKTELIKISGMIQGGAHCICISGCVGIGKSRFVKECLSEIHDDFDGALYLSTHSTNINSWLKEVFEAIHLEIPNTFEKKREGISNYLSGLGRVLLVIDGIIPSSKEFHGLLETLQKANSRAVWLFATSERLSIPEDQILELHRLEPAQAIEMLNDRLQLRAVSFSEIDPESEAYQGLLGVLDGHPHSIELAAAALSPNDLQGSLNIVSESLSQPSADNPLMKSLQHRWAKLGPFAKLACVQLSVMDGLFSVEAAEAVIKLPPAVSRPMILDLLGMLYDQSWIYSNESNGIPHFGIMRFIQVFLRERFSPRDAQAARIRHAAFYAGWSDSRFNTKFEKYGTYLAQREVQHTQFLCAMKRSIKNRWIRLAARNAMSAIEVHLMSAEAHQAYEIIRPMLGMPRLPPWEMGRLLTLYASILRHEGRYSLAMEQLFESIRLLSMIRDSNGLLDAYTELIYVSTDAGQFDQIELAVARFLEIQTDNTLQHRIGLFAKAEGYSYAQQGKTTEALERLEHAASILWSLRDPVNTVSALTSIGVTHLRIGKPIDAERFFENALQIMQEAGLIERVDHLWMNLGLTAIMTGKLVHARQYFAHAYQRYQTLQAIQPLALLYANTAMLHLIEEDVEAARAWISEAHQLLVDKEHPIAKHTLYKVEGMLQLYIGVPDKAVHSLKKALDLVHSHGLSYKSADTMAFYAEALARSQHLKEATEILHQASVIAGEEPSLRFICLCIGAILYDQQEEKEGLNQALTQASLCLDQFQAKRPDLRFQMTRVCHLLNVSQLHFQGGVR